MSLYHVSFKGRTERKNKGKIPGMIIMIVGIAMIIWYATDTIFIHAGMRTNYLTDMQSIVRLVLGIIFTFIGLWIQKVEDMKTLRPR